jgi:hypothetical protein
MGRGLLTLIMVDDLGANLSDVVPDWTSRLLPAMHL